jgi:hypothetical protein
MRPDWEPSDRFEEWQGCLGCGHYRLEGRAACIAYPDRIPLPILSGEVDHMVPRPGQVGTTVFTPMDFEHFRRTGRRVPQAVTTSATSRG